MAISFLEEAGLENLTIKCLCDMALLETDSSLTEWLTYVCMYVFGGGAWVIRLTDSFIK